MKHQNIRNNLVPYVCQVAAGQREFLGVFGDDWDTSDGTGVRDYIHIMDLADAHVKAYDHLTAMSGAQAINLGTGQGFSVLELVTEFSAQLGREVPYQIVSRRSGDIASSWADPTFAQQVLGWKAKHGIKDMVASAWAWHCQYLEHYYRG